MRMGTVVLTHIGVSRNGVGVVVDQRSDRADVQFRATSQINTIALDAPFLTVVKAIGVDNGLLQQIGECFTFIPVSQLLLVFEWDHDRPNSDLTAYITTLSGV